MARSFDIFVAYKFIRILTTSWEDMEAFDLGIIDKDGKVLRKSSSLKTQQEKNSYTIFHRLIFSIKRILEKLPFGKTKLSSYAAGLFLIKESKSILSEDVRETPFFISPSEIKELDECFTEIMENISTLAKGEYKLVNDVFVGDKKRGKRGDVVVNRQDQKSETQLLGDKVFEVFHKNSKSIIFVSLEDLTTV